MIQPLPHPYSCGTSSIAHQRSPSLGLENNHFIQVNLPHPWHYGYMHKGVCLSVLCMVQSLYLPLQADFLTLPAGTTPALNNKGKHQLYYCCYIPGTLLSALPVRIVHLHQNM